MGPSACCPVGLTSLSRFQCTAVRVVRRTRAGFDCGVVLDTAEVKGVTSINTGLAHPGEARRAEDKVDAGIITYTVPYTARGLLLLLLLSSFVALNLTSGGYPGPTSNPICVACSTTLLHLIPRTILAAFGNVIGTRYNSLRSYKIVICATHIPHCYT